MQCNSMLNTQRFRAFLYSIFSLAGACASAVVIVLQTTDGGMRFADGNVCDGIAVCVSQSVAASNLFLIMVQKHIIQCAL